MIQWVFRILILAGAPLLGYYQLSPNRRGALMGLALAVLVIGVEIMLQSVPLFTLIFGGLGAVMGLIFSKLLDYAVVQMDNDKLLDVWQGYSVLVRVALAYLGMVLMIKKVPELDQLDRDILAMGRKRGQDLKILDTSAVIDGRVVDICETKFVSGTLVIPRFVLQELHALADSADPLKRAKGRRGLDILARLQENSALMVKIMDRDFPDVSGVDSKVVRLAKDLNARVVTTDFNLNKVAALEGVTVLNVNDLSTALKPVVLPGETMTLFVMKDGKEKDQGVGYLDDGTMVVVEDGRRWIGKRIEVGVASILQTSAGRMIFARFKGEKA